MSVPARLEYQQLTDSRSARRHTLHLGSVLAESGEEVLIHDLSTSGFQIETSAVFSPGAMLQVELPERGVTAAWVVWREDRLYGCEFVSPVTDAVVSAARLRNPLPLVETTHGKAPETAKPNEHGLYSPRARMVLIAGLAAILWLMFALAARALV